MREIVMFFLTHTITAILPLRHQEKFREGINVTQKSLIVRNSNEVNAFKEYVSDKFHFANAFFFPSLQSKNSQHCQYFFPDHFTYFSSTQLGLRRAASLKPAPFSRALEFHIISPVICRRSSLKSTTLH